MLQGLVDGLRLFLDRRDAAHTAPKFDEREMQTALIEFYEVADHWAATAWELTAGVRRWQQAEALDGYDPELVRLQLEKTVAVDEFARWSEALARQLRIYAPELDRDLRALSGRSARNLRSLLDDLAVVRREGSADDLENAVRALEDRTREVSELIEALRAYIKRTYPLGRDAP